MPHLIPTPTPATLRSTGGVAFHHTAIDGRTVVWCRADRAGGRVVQAVIDPAAQTPARRVTGTGTEPLPGETPGLTVYGHHIGDRPDAATAALLTPEHAALMGMFDRGEGTTTFAGGPEALLTPADVALKLHVAPRTVHKYHTDGRLPRAEHFAGRTPMWPQALIDQVAESRRGPGRPKRQREALPDHQDPRG